MRLLPILAAVGLLLTQALSTPPTTPASPVQAGEDKAAEFKVVEEKIKKAHDELDEAQKAVIEKKRAVRDAMGEKKKLHWKNRHHKGKKECEKKDATSPVEPAKPEESKDQQKK